MATGRVQTDLDGLSGKVRRHRNSVARYKPINSAKVFICKTYDVGRAAPMPLRGRLRVSYCRKDTRYIHFQWSTDGEKTVETGATRRAGNRWVLNAGKIDRDLVMAALKHNKITGTYLQLDVKDWRPLADITIDGTRFAGLAESSSFVMRGQSYCPEIGVSETWWMPCSHPSMDNYIKSIHPSTGKCFRLRLDRLDNKPFSLVNIGEGNHVEDLMMFHASRTNKGRELAQEVVDRIYDGKSLAKLATHWGFDGIIHPPFVDEDGAYIPFAGDSERYRSTRTDYLMPHM
jgi:hypothetical protein